MTNTNIEGTLETTLVGALPSPFRPYAKALIAAAPPLFAAFGVLQAGHYTAVAVLQFILAVVTTAGVYFVPALPVGKWEAASKTIVAGVGAVLSAGLAAFGGGGLEGWIGFGTAALAAVLVEVVDNVPNAAHEVLPIASAVEQVAGAISKVPLPEPHEVSAEG
jgi:hypothetical protein